MQNLTALFWSTRDFAAICSSRTPSNISGIFLESCYQVHSRRATVLTVTEPFFTFLTRAMNCLQPIQCNRNSHLGTQRTEEYCETDKDGTSIGEQWIVKVREYAHSPYVPRRSSSYVLPLNLNEHDDCMKICTLCQADVRLRIHYQSFSEHSHSRHVHLKLVFTSCWIWLLTFTKLPSEHPILFCIYSVSYVKTLSVTQALERRMERCW
jgi:hypothetical protein